MSPPAPTDEVTARERWVGLRAGGHAAAGLEIPTSPTDVDTAAGLVRFALGPNNEPRILLPVPHGAKLPKLPTSTALHIGDVVYHQGSIALRFIDLICLSKDLETVFGEVADEMLDRIRKGASCIKACQSTLEDFRSLLLASAEISIRNETLLGLVGELLVLDRLSDSDAAAWRLWRGPLGERHDFRAGDRAIEVKSTSRAGNTVILISSIDQLLPPTGGTLHVFHLALEPVQGGPLSVGTLVASVKTKTNRPDEITSRLAAVGCANPDASEWNRTCFRLEKESLYRVDNEFPKIVPSTFGPKGVSAGITSVQYEVDLSSAASSLIDHDKSTAVLTELIACLSQN